MKARTFLFKLSAAVAPLVAALAMGSAPVAQAAAPPIIVDTAGPTATDCGKYNGKTAQTDPVSAINNAPSGRTVIICPGTYTLTGGITIAGKKLTIKRALTGAGSRPILDIDNAVVMGMDISDSSVTIDGLIVDGVGNPANYIGISLVRSSATIKNTALIGPNQFGTTGVFADAFGQPKVLKVSITNSYIAGYTDNGVYVQGLVKLTVSSSHLDATDGGRVASGAFGVFFNGGSTLGVRPTGTVTRSRLINNDTAVMISGVDKVSVANNTLIDNAFGVYIIAGDQVHSANNNKIIGNTILGVPASGIGVYVNDIGVPTFTIKKTTISKNTIVAAQYTPGGVMPTGIQVEANASAATLVTATITGNTLLGFPPTRRIVNVSDFAGLKIRGNDAIP